jgi:hypothetical protein
VIRKKVVSEAAILLTITAIAFAMFFSVHFLPPWAMRVSHVVLFAAWTWSLARLAGASNASNAVTIAVIAGLIAAGAGEVIQYWVPMHQVEWSGFFASTAGVLCGAWIARKGSE